MRPPSWSKLPISVGVACSTLLSCASSDQRFINRDLPEDPVGETLIRDMDASFAVPGDAGVAATDPHALLGVSPNHGPFSGGQTVWIRGNGFLSDARVWFGDVPGENTVSVDPNRIQTTTPPGVAGSVDVIVQNGDDTSTRRALSEGYEYDAFIVEPSTGPTVGGTLVTLSSRDSDWDDETRVTIDLVPCEVETVQQADNGLFELTCRTPPGTPGQKVVSVETASGAATSVAGAFAYSELASDFESGLSGAALDGSLSVAVFSGLTGAALPGASVVLGSEHDPARVLQTDGSGTALFRDAELGLDSLGPEQTVTVFAECMNPVTLVDVAVEQVTLFLDPILTPECIPPSLDNLPIGGGAGAAPTHRVSGELLWGEGLEFRPGPWFNVGSPKHDREEQVAYVFELSTSPDAAFVLPTRFDAVTVEDKGTYGYIFEYDTRSLGNVTLYAIAGVEDQSVTPRRFTPYAFGMLRGVDPAAEPTGLLMEMDIGLDHRIAFDVEAPATTDQGPDRLAVDLALRVGALGYVKLPGLQQEKLLPNSAPVAFVGVPALAGPLARAEYLAQFRAVTGPDDELPASHIELLSTRQTDAPTRVDDFVPVPIVETPERGASWDGQRLLVAFEPGGSFDLLRFDILVPSRALTWRVIAPAARIDIELPPLREYGLDLPAGNVTVGVAAARVENFDPRALKERNYSSRGWSAYALHSVAAVLE